MEALKEELETERMRAEEAEAQASDEYREIVDPTTGKSSTVSEFMAELKMLRDGTEKIQQDAEEAKKRAEESEQKIEELKKSLEEADREFEEYRKKYTSKVRDEMKGKKFAEWKTKNNKVYRDVVIKEVTDTRLRFSHAGGGGSLKVEQLDPALVDRLRMMSDAQWKELQEAKARELARQEEEKKKAEEEARLAEMAAKGGTSKPSTQRSHASHDAETMDPEVQQELSRSVLVIEGNGSVGTGFVAKEGSAYYVYTAAHVLNGNTKLKIVDKSGTVFKDFGSFEICRGADLCRLRLKAKPKHFLEMATPGDGLVEMTKKVAVMGNGGGGSVVGVTFGRINGLGDKTMEMTARVAPGSSGGPVISVGGKKGSGLGDPCHVGAERRVASGTSSSKVRRFARRTDLPMKWVKMGIGSFVKEKSEIATFDNVTQLLFALGSLTPTKQGMRLDQNVGGSDTVLTILKRNVGMKAVRDLVQMNSDLEASKLGVSERDLLKRYRSYYSQILSAASRQEVRFSPGNFSDFNKTQIVESRKWRTEARRLLVARIAAMK